MRWGRIAGLSFFAIVGSSLGMPPYEMPKWEGNPEPALIVAAEKERGVKIAAALWQTDLFDDGASVRYLSGVMTGIVRTIPLQTAPRVQRGIMLRVYKEAGQGKAWWPGSPYRWHIENTPWPYAIVAKPKNLPADPQTAELAKRIFDQPMEVTPGVSDDELIALTDYFWRLAIDQRTHPNGHGESGFGVFGEASAYPVGPLFTERGQPFFQNLDAVKVVSEMKEPWRLDHDKTIRPTDFALALSQDGDGVDVIYVQKHGRDFRVIFEEGVDF